MATYKLIQDIEAEDHILGPLTLRQFIYGLVAAFCFYMSFIGIAKHFWPLTVMFLPVALFTGFFAFPFGKDQPTEVWALAKIRFLFKPRRRIWDQSGVKELVTITVPKRAEKVYTNGLTQNEVKSRLSALANTIDSRGWAVKNVNVNLYGQPSALATVVSDRLIDPSSIPQAVPEFDVQASDDMLDEHSNPVALQFDQMMVESAKSHRQQLINQMNAPSVPTPPQGQATPQPNYWFMNQPTQKPNIPADQALFQDAQVVQPGIEAPSQVQATAEVTPEEEAIVAKAKEASDSQKSVMNSHLRTIQPLGSAPPAAQEPSTATAKQPDPVIQQLATNDDFNIDTIARQAKKAKESDQDGEVTISLR
ncbi:MAG TPA: PrgI family protein [Candidatus Saccharimonadales bacterium]|nr:PrgI family protein [Candidatus Saccharimonadales bacterium]